jgi:hypothetical protein
MLNNRGGDSGNHFMGLGAGVYDDVVDAEGNVYQFAASDELPLPLLSNQFFIDIQQTAKHLGVLPEDLLVVMAGESGLNPHMNTGGGHGLISLTQAAAGGAGVANLDQFSAMNGESQLPYIENYFRSASAGFPYRNAFDLYFAEAATGTYANYRKRGYADANEIMYQGGAWANNPGLDNYPILTQRHGDEISRDLKSLGYTATMAKWSAIGKAEGILKGYVTVGDFVRYAKAVIARSNWRDGVRRLRNVQGSGYNMATDPYLPTAGKSKAWQDPGGYDADSRMTPLDIHGDTGPVLREGTSPLALLKWTWIGSGVVGAIVLLRIFLRKKR